MSPKRRSLAMVEQRNIEFVLEVEKHPCLYNSTLMDYARKDLTDKAWREVGDKLDMSGPQCKEKWKNLRTVLARNLRQTSGSSPKRRKPYYLLEAMKFTIPFIKSPYIVHAAHFPETVSDHEDNDMNSQECITEIKVEDETIYESYNQSASPSPRSVQSSQIENYHQLSPQMYSLLTPSLVMEPDPQPETKCKVRKRSKDSKDSTDSDENLHDYAKSKKARSEKNLNKDLAKISRKRFLLSLLPDVYSMNDEQIRSFRIKVLNIMEEIVQTKSGESS